MFGGWVKKVKGLKKQIKILTDTYQFGDSQTERGMGGVRKG